MKFRLVVLPHPASDDYVCCDTSSCSRNSACSSGKPLKLASDSVLNRYILQINLNNEQLANLVKYGVFYSSVDLYYIQTVRVAQYSSKYTMANRNSPTTTVTVAIFNCQYYDQNMFGNKALATDVYESVQIRTITLNSNADIVPFYFPLGRLANSAPGATFLTFTEGVGCSNGMFSYDIGKGKQLEVKIPIVQEDMDRKKDHNQNLQCRARLDVYTGETNAVKTSSLMVDVLNLVENRYSPHVKFPIGQNPILASDRGLSNCNGECPSVLFEVFDDDGDDIYAGEISAYSSQFNVAPYFTVICCLTLKKAPYYQL